MWSVKQLVVKIPCFLSDSDVDREIGYPYRPSFRGSISFCIITPFIIKEKYFQSQLLCQFFVWEKKLLVF